MMQRTLSLARLSSTLFSRAALVKAFDRGLDADRDAVSIRRRRLCGAISGGNVQVDVLIHRAIRLARVGD